MRERKVKDDSKDFRPEQLRTGVSVLETEEAMCDAGL